jgi:hypothetical protein
MSTRACYRFIDPDLSDPDVVTVYKRSSTEDRNHPQNR